MTIAEQIYELVKSLPQDRANQVLAFAESIHAEYLNTDPSTEADPPEDWAVLVYSLAGSWDEDFPRLEDIRANLGQGIPRESL